VAAGAALGSKLKGDGRVALCFFGDGASNQGTFHESLNLAAIWDLPVVYVCENNKYGELTAASEAISVEDVSARAGAYGIPGTTVDGQDVVAVFDAVSRAVERARKGDGPSLVETKTYRFENHAIGLRTQDYRSADEVEEWTTHRDPLVLFRAALADRGIDAQELEQIDKEVTEEVAAAVEFARGSAPPPPEAAFTHLFTNPIPAP
jgi:pyruvate dehydrogenase E1 component alpha subunit